MEFAIGVLGLLALGALYLLLGRSGRAPGACGACARAGQSEGCGVCASVPEEVEQPEVSRGRGRREDTVLSTHRKWR